jgi:mono/diheme cytochrome c family protein
MAVMRLFLLPLLLLLLACGGTSEKPVARAEPLAESGSGERIFNMQCALCHGRKGDKTLSGAKLLNKSTLTRDEMIGIVSYGKGGMMAYKETLTAQEIKAVVDHALTLRTP